MLTPRIRAALVVLAASAGLSACTSLGPYGGVGVGVGSQYGYGGQYGYDPYYSGYGYGSGYGSPYGYAGYGSGYGYDPFGWYNGYYYPGSGYWVYDRDRHRRTLTPEERAYWLERIQRYRAQHGTGTTSTAATTSVPTGQQVRENWSGFNRRRAASVDGTATAGTTTSGTATASATGSGREVLRQRVVEQRAQRAQVSAERQQARTERQQARQSDIQERSEARPSRRPKE